MTQVKRWLLPDGLEEALPVAARHLECLRREVLDQFDRWGYDLVIPPLAEYLDSLLTGVGSELEQQTFKCIDPVNGRLLGLRADLTPQVARIDAHRLQQAGTVRLCYTGSVLRTEADESSGSRSPLQAGAELYGHDGLDSDVEIIRLMLATLESCGVTAVSIDLGHVAIYRTLAAAAGLDAVQEQVFFDLLQRKAIPEMDAILRDWSLQDPLAGWLRALAEWNGGLEVLEQASLDLQTAPLAVGEALAHLRAVVDALYVTHPQLDIHLDLGELRGYSYHTGLVFAAFVPGSGQEIARGGRYNEIGRVFGRARPATGFSTDLRQLARLAQPQHPPLTSLRCVRAPAQGAAGLEQAVQTLRSQGVRVRRQLAGESLDEYPPGPCLVWREGQWIVEEI